MADRWWDPAGPATALLEPGDDRQLDVANALVALHRSGAAALLVAADTPLVDDATVKQSLADARAAYAGDIVESIGGSLGDPSYAGLLVRDVADDAETAAMRLYYTCVSKGVSPPIAVNRVAAIYGVPGADLGKYAAMASTPVANQIALTDLADRALFGWVHRASNAEIDTVSKAYDAAEARDAKGEWTKTKTEVTIGDQSVSDWLAAQVAGTSVGPAEVATGPGPAVTPKTVSDQFPRAGQSTRRTVRTRRTQRGSRGVMVPLERGQLEKGQLRKATVDKGQLRKEMITATTTAKAQVADPRNIALPLHDGEQYTVLDPSDMAHRLDVASHDPKTVHLNESRTGWLRGQEFHDDESTVAELLTRTDMDSGEGEIFDTNTYSPDRVGLRDLQAAVREAMNRSNTVEVQMRRVHADGGTVIRATIIDHTVHHNAAVMNVLRWGEVSAATDHDLHWGGEYRLLTDEQVDHWTASSWASTVEVHGGMVDRTYWLHNPKVDYWEIHDNPGT